MSERHLLRIRELEGRNRSLEMQVRRSELAAVKAQQAAEALKARLAECECDDEEPGDDDAS